ncbi:hypothetical protein [Winogradskyella pulchriflava]|uniref:STAS/SEC14 domain-containing protein n=1 Tax=Winogradskyella pulchriflava TaxID=1110688 RepID=A0ABV6QAH8_9FLAO
MIDITDLESRKYDFHKTNIGDLYFFKDFFIAELNEGINITFENFYEASILIKKYYEDRPFGFISNRKNSYSIDVNDANLYQEAFPNLKAYAIVVYSSLSERIYEIENHFFKFNRKAFKTLDEAIDWVEGILSK